MAGKEGQVSCEILTAYGCEPLTTAVLAVSCRRIGIVNTNPKRVNRRGVVGVRPYRPGVDADTGFTFTTRVPAM